MLVATRYYLAWCFICKDGKQLPVFQLEAALYHLCDTGKGFVSQDFWVNLCKIKSASSWAASLLS